MGGGFQHGSYIADILLPDDKVRGERRSKEKELRAGEAWRLWKVASSSITGWGSRWGRLAETIHKWTDIYIIDSLTTSRPAAHTQRDPMSILPSQVQTNVTKATESLKVAALQSQWWTEMISLLSSIMLYVIFPVHTCQDYFRLSTWQKSIFL